MSVAFYGDYDLTETVRIPFNTFDSNDPSASVTVTDLVAGDIKVYGEGVIGTPTGITVSLNVSVTGNHFAIIDLTDTNDAGFYAVGSRYAVRMEGVTIDGATVNAWIGAFSIGCTLRPATAGRTLTVSANGEGNADLTFIHGTALTETATQLAGAFVKFFDVAAPTATALSLPDAVPDAAGGLPISDAGGLDLDNLLIDGLKDAGIILTTATIEAVTSQTELTIPATADATDNDSYNGALAVIIDGTDPNQRSIRRVTDYVAATRSIHIELAADFVVTTADTIVVLSTAVQQNRLRVG